MSKAVSFTCVNCGDEYPAKLLSLADFRFAGTRTRAQALELLDEATCVFCEQEAEEDTEVFNGGAPGGIGARTVSEAFEWDNLPISQGMAVFITNNW